MINTQNFYSFSVKQWLSAMLFAGFATALLFGALLTFNPVAKAASATCYDITGQGTQVLKGGVPNAGVIHFDTLVPSYALEACVEDNNFPLGDGNFDVKGWAWDDNLGWISFYCGDENLDGPPYENLGISCGTVQYGVTMEGLGGTNPGRLAGYAWGDNTGYVSFNCSNDGTCGTSDYYVEAESSQSSCLGEVFSAPSPPGCASRPPRETYAWSDNVGWIDFTDTTFPWVQLVGLAVNVELEILSDGTDLLSANKLTAPVSDGSDSYQMILHMTKSTDGTPVDIPSDYDVTVTATWSDTVDVDQTDSTNGNHSATNGNPDGAVTKVFDFSSFDAYGTTVADGFVADVTSLAPTSSMNGYDDGGDGTVDSSYESFVLGGPAFTLPQNRLALTSLTVSVEHTPTGICAFGGSGCSEQSVTGSYANQAWHFAPAIDVSEFSDSINADTISARHLVANSIDYVVDCLGTLGACTGTISTQTGVNSPFEFVYDSAQDGSDCTDPSSFDLLSTLGSPLQLTPVWEDDGLGGCITEGPQTGDDAYVFTEVNYSNGGKNIAYYSNKLPRVQGTLVVNPVAEISGNVYSTGVTNPQTGQKVRSLGDVSTNLLRDAISRNVESIIAGVPAPSGNDPEINGWSSGFNITGAYTSFLPDLIYGQPKVYYFAQDLVIYNLDWPGERTFIVKGADVYIKENILSTTPNAKLGIIVLKDLATGEGGNVYISPEVTNIQANIFADGSIFSWTGVDAWLDLNADGVPIWTDEAERFNTLRDQLYIQGSIASLNTIGGAVRPEPILGDGTVASSTEGQYGNAPTGRSAARLYDLNFLRYYGLVFERFNAGNAPDPSCIGDAIDQQDTGNCIATDPSYTVVAESLVENPSDGDLVLISGGNPSIGLDPNSDFSAVYVEFDPPSIGLPGFSSIAGVDIRLLP